MLGLLAASSAVAMVMAFSIGAQDVSNALGTSVGSKAITARQAVLIAGVCEFLGALGGGEVASTISSGILHPEALESYGDAAMTMTAFVYFSAMTGSCVWLVIATWQQLPVSTSHSLVGSLLGVGLLLSVITDAPAGTVQWASVGKMVASWVVSPVLGGAISFAVFHVIHWRLLQAPHPVAATRTALPYFTGVTVGVLAVFLGRAGPAQFRLAMLPALVFGVVFGLAAYLYAATSPLQPTKSAVKALTSPPLKTPPPRRRTLDARTPATEPLVDRAQPLTTVVARVGRVVDAVDADAADVADLEAAPTTGGTSLTTFREVSVAVSSEPLKLHALSPSTSAAPKPTTPGGGSPTGLLDAGAADSGSARRRALNQAEAGFVPLMVLTACVVSFAHGSNDVSNAIGPFAAIAEIYFSGHLPHPGAGTPLWILVAGGVGIVVGLAVLGHKVMATVGTKVAKLSFSRGYAAQFASALTVLTASQLGLTLSTTHVVIGAISGAALVEGWAKINMATIRRIVVSWVVTVPAAAFFSVIVYAVCASRAGQLFL